MKVLKSPTRVNELPRNIIVGHKFSVKPNYIVRSNIWLLANSNNIYQGRETDKNLQDNSHTGAVSAQTEKKIRSAVNWLCAQARQKWVPECKEHKGFYFKVNFITLTLPALNTHITADNIHKLLLQPFLDNLRKTYFLNLYVSKIELQKNGNPHVHLTTDTYIHWTKLRNLWNKQLAKEGLLELYKSKYTGCKFADYAKWHPPTELVDVAKTYERWQYGNQSNWESPNTTDVHAVRDIKDLAAYISKYMAKDLNAEIMVKGLSAMATPRSTARMWSCSQQLSAAYSASFEMTEFNEEHQLDCLYKSALQVKQVLGNPDKYGIRHPICDVFFIKPHDWHTKIKGVLKYLYDTVKYELQNAYRNTIAPVPRLA